MRDVLVTVKGKQYKVFIWNNGCIAYIETFGETFVKTIWHADNNRALGPIAIKCVEAVRIV